MASKYLDSTGVKHLWDKIKNTYQPKGNYVTTDTTQTISGTKTYTGNNIFKNNYFEIKASSANDDSWIKLTNATDSGYYAFGIRRPYATYGLQMKYHPVSGDDVYYNIWHAGNFTPSNYLTTSAAASTYQPKGDYLTPQSLTSYATQTWVNTQISNLVNSAPEALNTLGELATALKNHEDAYDALLTTVGGKLDKSSVSGTSGYIPKFSGTNSIGNSVISQAASNKTTIGGKLVVNAGADTSSGNCDEGIRVLPASGWAEVFLSNDTSITGTGGWLVARRGSAGTTSGTVGDFTIEYGGWQGNGLTLYANGNRPRWKNNELAYKSDIPTNYATKNEVTNVYQDLENYYYTSAQTDEKYISKNDEYIELPGLLVADRLSTNSINLTDGEIYFDADTVLKLPDENGGVFATRGWVENKGYKTTDTNTWRPVVNNLTSTATDSSLSAAQGKALNDKFASYLPKSGGSFNDSVDVTWTKYNRKMIINGNNITFDPTADTGTYAGSLLDVKHTKGTTTAVGVYGNYSEGLTHIFMGGSYDDPAMKMDASGNFTFKNLVTLTHDKAQLQFRGGHASYDGVISYQSAGNEAMVFSTKNVVTSFMFVNGEDTVKNVSSNRWTALTPGFQIKNNKVSISKLIPDGTTPTYNLDVGGTANATTIYENGTALSDKYQAKGSGGSGMTTVAYNVDLTDGDSIDLKPYINEGYKVFKGFIQTNDQVDETITINVNGSRFTFNDNYLDHHIEIIRFSNYNGGNHSIMIQGSDGNAMGWSQASGSGFYITYSLSNGGSVSASITLYAFK